MIRRFDAIPDDDLMLCPARGIAYQRNMKRGRLDYGVAYFEKFCRYAGTPTELALNAGRIAMLRRHAAPGATVIDFGIGNGGFVLAAREAGFDARGFDINPAAVAWLRERDLYADDLGAADVVTFWDSIEHIEDPHLTLRNVRKDAFVLVAAPIFDDLKRIRESKHYKPGEHLYYFSPSGLIDYMALYGFRPLEISAHEMEAGREDIGSVAFRRDLPDYGDHIVAYRDMHAMRHYGSSATELHLEAVAGVVRRLKPRAILDYGCGRSDLVAHFWRDGERRIARYDPAIPPIRRLPKETFDLVLCCDVLEHIPMGGVDRVLQEVRSKADVAFFTVSTKLARAKLPDGRNAHVTLLTAGEWKRWIGDYFGPVERLPSAFEHELVFVAGAAAAERRAA